MNQEKFWKEFSNLPPTAQDLVTDFVMFLQVKYQTKITDKQPENKTDIRDEPFVGMWKARTELVDSTDYVRSLRANEWGGVGD